MGENGLLEQLTKLLVDKVKHGWVTIIFCFL